MNKHNVKYENVNVRDEWDNICVKPTKVAKTLRRDNDQLIMMGNIRQRSHPFLMIVYLNENESTDKTRGVLNYCKTSINS